jgi:Family of unknown function (DUF6152)
MNLRTGAFIALASLLVAGSAWAHHNMSALYDFNDRVTFSGTLTKMDWRNPHIELVVDTKNGGEQVETWSLEGPPPGFFRARDITKVDIEAAIGKTVTAEASRARDGSHAGLLRVMTLPQGKVVSACPQNC